MLIQTVSNSASLVPITDALGSLILDTKTLRGLDLQAPTRDGYDLAGNTCRR